MLILYFAPGSSSFAVHIALHEIGVPFEGKPMSFKSNDLRSPAYLKLNPEGKVPTLIVDGRPLTEVAAILYFLAKRFPDAELLPTRRRSHGCPLPPPRCIPRAGTDWTMPKRSME
jgi:glutathione S-transferase